MEPNSVHLADALGVSFQAVQKYEAGENRLSASRLFAAATTLGVSVSFFVYEEVDPGEDDANSRVSFSSKEIELIRSIRLIAELQSRHGLIAMIMQIAVSSVRPEGEQDHERKSA